MALLQQPTIYKNELHTTSISKKILRETHKNDENEGMVNEVILFYLFFCRCILQ